MFLQTKDLLYMQTIFINAMILITLNYGIEYSLDVHLEVINFGNMLYCYC